jgi:hypothetical protein
MLTFHHSLNKAFVTRNCTLCFSYCHLYCIVCYMHSTTYLLTHFLFFELPKQRVSLLHT